MVDFAPPLLLSEKPQFEKFGIAQKPGLTQKPEKTVPDDVKSVVVANVAPDESKKVVVEEKKFPPRSRYEVVRWTSYALDYWFVLTMFSAFNFIWSGEHLADGEILNAVSAAKMMMIGIVGLIVLDLFKSWAFRDVLASIKLKHIDNLFSELSLMVRYPFTVPPPQKEDDEAGGEGDSVMAKLMRRPQQKTTGLEKLGNFLRRVFVDGEGIWTEWADKTEQRKGALFHIFYILKLTLIFWVAVYALGVCRFFTFQPLGSILTTVELGSKFSLPIPLFVKIYGEYLTMSFIRDMLSFNIVHEMMHKRFYSHHKIHHMPMQELSIINLWFFDLLDITVEVLVAPVLWIAIKFMINPLAPIAPSMHFASLLMILCEDVNCHSICPYTVTFWNPILDSRLKPCLSHNLHHALNTGHFTIFPLHQIPGICHYDPKQKKNVDGSIQGDFDTYNTVFGTNFPA